MIKTRLSDERGRASHGWLEARHSFAFGNFYDPDWEGYSALRVINEDRVAPGTGFPPHSHRDMEIITYVLGGSLRHQDSTGGGADLVPGELQVMHAGRGITHSEVNPSRTAPTHLLQIWIIPAKTGVAPAYEQSVLDRTALQSGFVRVVAPQGVAAQFNIHQDASLWIGWPRAGATFARALDPARRYYLHVARGSVRAGDRELGAGDALMLEQEAQLSLRAIGDAEVLLFDLP